MSANAVHPAIVVLREDPMLAPVIDRHGPYEPTPQPFANTFEPLARAIVYQQLSGKAAGTIYGRFVAAFGDGDVARAETVAAATEDALRTTGLSKRKAEYVLGLAAAELDGTLPTPRALAGMDDEAIIEALTEQRGIGRWTVEMLLMAWLGRPDVLPVADLGIRKGLAIIDGLDELPDAQALTRRAECWRPYRTTACWYLWRAAEIQN